MKHQKLVYLLMASLCSCSFGKNESLSPFEKTVMDSNIENGEVYIPLNTITKLKIYPLDSDKDKFSKQTKEIFDDFQTQIISLSKQFDRSKHFDGYTNVYDINESCGTGQELKVSDELFELLSLAMELTKLTEGRFNLAMGNLIDLYNPQFEFANEKMTSNLNENVFLSLPSKEDIEKAVSSIPTLEKIEEIIVLDETNKTVRLEKYNEQNVVISLGAIGKGFAIDKTLDKLKAYENPMLVDAGNSTLATLKRNPSNPFWRIAFNSPSLFNQTKEFSCVIDLADDYYVSTSADNSNYYKYKDSDGKVRLMHHIIDPISGISNNYVRSCSIISNNCSLAILDALSTSSFNCKTTTDFTTIIKNVQEEFKVNFDYMLLKPNTQEDGSISFNEYSLDMSKNFNIFSRKDSFSHKITNKNIIE